MVSSKSNEVSTISAKDIQQEVEKDVATPIPTAKEVSDELLILFFLRSLRDYGFPLVPLWGSPKRAKSYLTGMISSTLCV